MAGTALAKHGGSVSKPRHSAIEKQVTLEDQAICGALQTLNEEAMEDVLDEREADLLISSRDEMLHTLQQHAAGGYLSSNISTCSDPTETDVLYLQTSVVPELHLAGLARTNSIRGSKGLIGLQA